MKSYLLREKFRENPSLLHDSEIASLAGVKLPEGSERIGEYIDMSYDELLAAGLSAESAIVMQSIKEIAQRYLTQRMVKTDAITSPEKVVDFLRMKIGGLPHESFMILFLNVQNEVIKSEIINEGTVDQVAIYPRRIIEKALTNHAAAIIVAHNHPSGHTDPSEEDKHLTRKLKDACNVMDIRVLDHIIVGKYGYFSFLSAGWI